MADPFIGEIQAFAFGFYPGDGNWLPCDGRMMSIAQYSTLYSLIGVTYGGDGRTSFALPNFIGRVAISQGQGPGLSPYAIGSQVGQSTVTLTTDTIPAHVHPLRLGVKTSSNATAGPSATSNVAIDPNFNGFVAPPANTALSSNAVANSGGSQPHANNQPTLAMIYCIAIRGIYPTFGTS